VVFVGSLFMPNNIDGIEWYLKEIHPKLLDELRDYSFVIAGNIKGVDPNLLNKFKSYDRCEVIESPVSLDDIYRNGKVFVNPMRFGAGVKMKTLDAIINGLPVVTTTIGAEGLGLTPDKNILQSDNSRGFADAIGRLCLDTTKRNALWNSAREFLLQTYNSKTNLIQLLNNKGIY
jgi:glycosyltransferase involved in cell wall biosynthesis